MADAIETATAMPADTAVQDNAERSTGRAMLRGWRGRCPSCGDGKILYRYLKVVDSCPACGEELHHQRADDGPAYLTVLFVSHLLGPAILAVFIAWRPDPVTMLLGFSFAAVALSLLLLPRVKGAMVGLQWARRMHGFEHAASPARARD
ncbi:DUF983 domain-containing protein [Paracoccus pacificus]|uniref:DUF983 domain-containing protein n=1 Tax=Paracoccus pacificus TaxID=1463598 RepID=A0ABW4R4K2_9RHOB